VAGIARCIEAGAEDYLSKPFDPMLLRARVVAALAKKRLRDAERVQMNILGASSAALSQAHAIRDSIPVRGAHPSRVLASASRRRLRRPRRDAEDGLRDAGAPRDPSIPNQAERSSAAGGEAKSVAGNKAVFLSYASQDADAAKRICEALRAAGIEVWFDRNELVGGDAWDAKIRKQIKECALFVPVISAHANARLEAYFRREWKLAVDRTHDMAEEKAFLVPVVIDATSEATASVPGRFREVQWTRLPGGETPPAFCTRLRALLASVGGPELGRPPAGGKG
jgi:hypothetical protein